MITHNFTRVEYSFATINGDEMIGIDCCISEGGYSIANVSHGPMFGSDNQMHEQTRANARRIAACINYCKYMSTEDMEEEVELNKLYEALDDNYSSKT